MSRHFLLSIAVICISLTTLHERSFGQNADCENCRTVNAGRKSARSARNRRQQENLVSYQLQAPSAEAIAAGRVANGKIAVAAKIGKLQAASDLLRAEADHAEVRPEITKRKLVARRQLAATNEEKWSWEAEQSRKRITERREAALARLAEVRCGQWPTVLMDEQYATLRDQLSAAVADRALLVAGGPGVDTEHAISVVGQMRHRLSGSLRVLDSNNYIQAKQFLDELKALTTANDLAGPSL